MTVGQRTAQINQIRGQLLEYGIEVPAGRSNLLKRLPEILEDAENGLTDLFREQLFGLYEELHHLNERIAHYDEKIEQVARTDERARRLQTIPGIGPKIATALLAAIGDVHSFKMVAWKDFIRAHLAVLAATDFFTVEALTLRGLVTYYVLFFIHLESRQVEVSGITPHPNERWMKQIARNVTMDEWESHAFRQIIKSVGVEPLRLRPRSPNLNAYAER